MSDLLTPLCVPVSAAETAIIIIMNQFSTSLDCHSIGIWGMHISLLYTSNSQLPTVIELITSLLLVCRSLVPAHFVIESLLLCHADTTLCTLIMWQGSI